MNLVTGETPARILTIERGGVGKAWFEAVVFCLRAAKSIKPDGSIHDNILYSGFGFIYGTDGHRLHAVRGIDIPIPDGSYRVICKSLNVFVLGEIDQRGPKIEDVIKTSGMKPIDLGPTIKPNPSVAYAKAIRSLPEDCGLNIQYFVDAIAGDGEWTLYVPEEPARRGLILLSYADEETKRGEAPKNRTVAIMPMKI